MKFINHYSSSRGNLYEVQTFSRRILIECGVSQKEILKAIDYRIQDIEACLVTHRHKDHCKALQDLLESGLDIYASQETFESFSLQWRQRAHIVADKTLITAIPELQVYCFDVHHDCDGALGFIVREIETNQYLLFATDTSHISQRFSYPFSIIAIECSYDQDLLEKQVKLGEINETVAKRLLTSHMERQATLKYITEYCDLSKCHEIHLLHGSGDRLNKQAARKQIEDATFIGTFIK